MYRRSDVVDEIQQVCTRMNNVMPGNVPGDVIVRHGKIYATADQNVMVDVLEVMREFPELESFKMDVEGVDGIRVVMVLGGRKEHGDSTGDDDGVHPAIKNSGRVTLTQRVVNGISFAGKVSQLAALGYAVWSGWGMALAWIV